MGEERWGREMKETVRKVDYSHCGWGDRALYRVLYQFFSLGKTREDFSQAADEMCTEGFFRCGIGGGRAHAKMPPVLGLSYQVIHGEYYWQTVRVKHRL